MKNKWFEGTGIIECTIQELKNAMDKQGSFFKGIVSFMPGLTSVELVEEGNDFVIIKTSEGLMKRTNISKKIEADRIELEFDEEYQAGRMVTATSHFSEEFTMSGNEVSHRVVISNVRAPGILGFFYGKLGGKNIGNAVLKSYQAYFKEKAAGTQH